LSLDVEALSLDSLGTTSESPAVRPARGPPDVELVEYTWY